MKDEQKLGVNLQWILQEVGDCDNPDYLHGGVTEVGNGDSFCQIEVIPMIAEAADRIQELEGLAQQVIDIRSPRDVAKARNKAMLLLTNNKE